MVTVINVKLTVTTPFEWASKLAGVTIIFVVVRHEPTVSVYNTRLPPPIHHMRRRIHSRLRRRFREDIRDHAGFRFAVEWPLPLQTPLNCTLSCTPTRPPHTPVKHQQC